VIRQIRRLSRTITVDEQRLRVIAVYMTRSDGAWALDDADDTGYEGVACVDDVARVAGLFLVAGRRHRMPQATAEATGYLRFLLYMQQPDGRFVNFILNWKGKKNLTGPTSVPGGPNWNARALRALALAAVTSGDRVYRDAFDRAFEPVTREMHYADIRALHVLAALELYDQHKEVHLRRSILAWCDQIAGLLRQPGAAAELASRRNAAPLGLRAGGRPGPRFGGLWSERLAPPGRGNRDGLPGAPCARRLSPAHGDPV